MAERKDTQHITLRVKPLVKAQLKVACDLLDITQSKRLHRTIAEIIKEGRLKVSAGEFESLTQEVLARLAEEAKVAKKTAGKLSKKRPKLPA